MIGHRNGAARKVQVPGAWVRIPVNPITDSGLKLRQQELNRSKSRDWTERWAKLALPSIRYRYL